MQGIHALGREAQLWEPGQRQGDEATPTIVHLFQHLAEHDPATAEHSLRVHSYAAGLADELGLNSEGRVALEVAALLHDIGKLGVPRAILTRPGKITAGEYYLLQKHPGHGEMLLRPFLPRAVLLAVRWHHERPDGKGYPDGLMQGEVPLLAQALAIIDAFDAMISDRPYSPAIPPAQALEILRAAAGTQFHAAIVERFAVTLRGPAGDPEKGPHYRTLQRRTRFVPY